MAVWRQRVALGFHIIIIDALHDPLSLFVCTPRLVYDPLLDHKLNLCRCNGAIFDANANDTRSDDLLFVYYLLAKSGQEQSRIVATALDFVGLSVHHDPVFLSANDDLQSCYVLIGNRLCWIVHHRRLARFLRRRSRRRSRRRRSRRRRSRRRRPKPTNRIPQMVW